MELKSAILDVATRRSACAVIGVYEGRRLGEDGKHADTAFDKLLSNVLRRGDMRGKAGESFTVHAPPGVAAERIVLVGMGPASKTSERNFRRAASTAATALDGLNAADACVYMLDANVDGRDLSWKARALAHALHERTYRFSGRPGKPGRGMPRKVFLKVGERGESRSVNAALAQAQALAGGVAYARELGDLPGNVCTPAHLASQARKLAQNNDAISVKVLGEAEMKRLGMNTLLAVSAGSEQPARLIVLEYKGAGARQKPVVLVGKGVTFDSGGISIKPAASMDEMKYDMCGAASVLGTLKAVAEMQLKVNLVVIVPATENLPSGTATRPGDVITSMSGKTVEILNTDAEGRLILCDALTYAERFDPDVIVDVATLTGACVVALGNVPTGLFSNHDGLSEELLAAGEYTGDRAWRMPVWEEFDEQLKSNFADLANVGGRAGGAITAARFLARFTDSQRWAHLDIAGTAWSSGASKGATGRPVPLLTEFVMQHKARRST